MDVAAAGPAETGGRRGRVDGARAAGPPSACGAQRGPIPMPICQQREAVPLARLPRRVGRSGGDLTALARRQPGEGEGTEQQAEVTQCDVVVVGLQQQVDDDPP